MPSRSRNAFNWIFKPLPIRGRPVEINRESGLPLVLGDKVAGNKTGNIYHIVRTLSGQYATQRPGIPRLHPIGIACGGYLQLSAEQANRRRAAYEKWLAKQEIIKV